MHEKSNTMVILAARHNSSRLPKKALKNILGKPLLEVAIRRLQKSTYASNVVVATTEASFPYFEEIIKTTNVLHYVGSEEDVLGRYTEAAEKFGLQTIVRATGDNPLVAIEALDYIIMHHHKSGADVSHYEGLPYGSGVEVISYSALKKSSLEAVEPFCREHITQYIYKNEDVFRVERPISPAKWNMPNLRLTVDTIEDYNSVLKIFEKYNDIYVDIETLIKDAQNISDSTVATGSINRVAINS